MKHTLPLLALMLAAALSLSGCASMLERSYVSSTAHVDYPVVEDNSILRAETYQGLVNSILYYVNAHSSSGSIQLYNYAGDVENDLERVCVEVVEQDPLAAYAVRTLTCDHTRILTYYEVDVQITYAHTAEEMEAIQPVSGLPALREELKRMVAERQEHAVLLTSYLPGDASMVEQLLLFAQYSQPTLYLAPNGGLLEQDVTLYPETGTRRVVEITARWDSDPSLLADYALQLEAAADLLLRANPPSGDAYTVAELAAILRVASGSYADHGADTALSALSGAPVSHLGLLLAMEYLCQRVGIEVFPVVGNGDSDGPWLIVSTPAGYRHLLPQALYSSPGTGNSLLYTDQELSTFGGYSWPSALYPACVDETSSPASVPQG